MIQERKIHANKLYQIMFDSKIFHHNPKSASIFINNNWNTIEQWWYSQVISKASFCNKFQEVQVILQKICFIKLINIYQIFKFIDKDRFEFKLIRKLEYTKFSYVQIF